MIDHYGILKKFLESKDYEGPLEILEKLKSENNEVGIIRMYNKFKKMGLKEQGKDCGCGCKGAGHCKPKDKLNEKKMNTKDLIKQMIREAIDDRISNIAVAGDMAANKAKLSQLSKDIQEAGNCISAIQGMANLKHYTSKEAIGDLIDDLNETIKKLKKEKEILEKASKPKEKNPSKPAAKKTVTKKAPAKKNEK